MDSPIFQRRDYGDIDQSNPDQTTNLNPTSSEENSKYTIIHILIIFSVITFVVIIGVILYLYRRRLRRLKSHTTNLNQIVNITHLSNNDDAILDYYSNDYNDDYNKFSSDSIIQPRLGPLEPVQEIENESELKPPSSPTQSLTKENRNYFIYGKSSGINSGNNNEIKRSDNNNIKNNNGIIKLNSDTNNDAVIKNNDEDIINNDMAIKSDKNNDEANNDILLKLKSDNNENILNSRTKLLNSKKRGKVNFNIISSPVTSPSDSIYNNEIADSLSRTTTRVIPPIPTFSPNKYTQPIRGPVMTEHYLIRQDSDAYTDASDATITIDTIFNDNPIMGITRDNNRIITTEEMVLDMIPISRYDGGSNFKN